MADFPAMTAAEARAFLDRWLEEGPERLGWLRRTAAATGGPELLDGTAAGLGPLWVWARTRFAWRRPEHPIDESVLPAWFYDPSGIGFDRFSDDTLWLVDAMARYWADVLLAAGLPGVRWGIGQSRVRGYVHQHHPVLLGFGDDLPPISIMGSLTSQSLTGSAGDDRLTDMYSVWLSSASPQH